MSKSASGALTAVAATWNDFSAWPAVRVTLAMPLTSVSHLIARQRRARRIAEDREAHRAAGDRRRGRVIGVVADAQVGGLAVVQADLGARRIEHVQRKRGSAVGWRVRAGPARSHHHQ